MINFKQSSGCELDAHCLATRSPDVEWLWAGIQIELEDAIVLGVSIYGSLVVLELIEREWRLVLRSFINIVLLLFQDKIDIVLRVFENNVLLQVEIVIKRELNHDLEIQLIREEDDLSFGLSDLIFGTNNKLNVIVENTIQVLTCQSVGHGD